MKAFRLNRNFIAIFVGLTLTISAVFFARTKERTSDFFPAELGTQFPCPGKEELTSMPDQYLTGLIEQGRPISISWNWYACNKPKRNEIAWVRISRQLAPRAKVIKGLPGDHIAIKKNQSGMGWNLFVNDKVILDSNEVAYTFGGKDLPPIGRYIGTRGEVLGSEEVIVLSTRSPGEFDSGLFGVSGVHDLVAKVTLKE